jgi:hypothetical protein
MGASTIFDAVIGFLRSINAVLSVVPALVWALVLAGAALYGSLMHHERDSAVSAKNVIQASYEQLTAKVIRQKIEAADLLKKLTAERDALQARINEGHNAQEKKDANNQATVDRLSRQLASVQLRDPGARSRDCRASPQGDAAAPTGNRAADDAAGGGVLSDEATRFLRSFAREADDINAAYESARADALICRAAQGASP